MQNSAAVIVAGIVTLVYAASDGVSGSSQTCIDVSVFINKTCGARHRPAGLLYGWMGLVVADRGRQQTVNAGSGTTNATAVCDTLIIVMRSIGRRTSLACSM